MGVPKSRCIRTSKRAGQATTAGTTSGAAPTRSLFSTDITQIGHHIIRNNIFRRCGQSAIVGNGIILELTLWATILEKRHIEMNFGK